jgi:hypothetical protein
MPDEKVKARTRKVEVSSLLSIDSPAVVWVLHAFDELRQVPGVIFAKGGGSGSSSGGESGSGEAGSSTTPRPKPEPPLPEPELFVPYCSLDHSLDVPGATVDGHWMGAVADRFEAASQEAQAHDDGALASSSM